VTPRIFGIPSSISPKPVKPENSILLHSFILALPTSVTDNISERGRGLGHVTLENLAYPRLYLKKIKLETSNFVHSFILTLPTRMKHNVSERGRGLGHVTPRIFGIPLSISPKLVKPEKSILVHSFTLALPTRVYNSISERGVAQVT